MEKKAKIILKLLFDTIKVVICTLFDDCMPYWRHLGRTVDVAAIYRMDHDLNDLRGRFRRNTHKIDHTALNGNISRKFPCHVHICVDICGKRKLN